MTIFSKENLNIRPVEFGDPNCAPVFVTRSRSAAYAYKYEGFTFLLRSGGRYFVTVTPAYPEHAWQPYEPVLVIPEDAAIRVQLVRGADYAPTPAEATAAGRLAFTC